MFWSAFVLALAVCLPFAAAEYWVRTKLFEHTLYSNSDAVDRALRDFRTRPGGAWDVLVLGDSEARWAINPQPIEAAFAAREAEIAVMNFAMDGFSTGWSPRMAEEMALRARMPNLKVVIFGVQLMELQTTVSQDNVCGALSDEGGFQAAIIKSAFARDWQVTYACARDRGPVAAAVEAAEAASAIVRYRQQLRALVLGRSQGQGPAFGLADIALPESYQGYQPHKPAALNGSFEFDLQRAKDEMALDPRATQPLEPDAWVEYVGTGGYFDQISQPYRDAGVLPVFVALPTNPLLIDLKNRRADYAANSARLADYAQRTGAVYLDLGVRDDYEPMQDFSDHRHLSDEGADKFSQALGARLVNEPKVVAALEP